MPLLSAFVLAYPRVRLEVTSGLGPELQRQFRSGEFDVLLVKQMGDSDDCLASWPEPLCWVDSRSMPSLGRDPLPLVAFPGGRGCTATKCCTTWKSAAGAGASAIPAPAWPACVRLWRRGWAWSLLPRRVVQPGHVEVGARTAVYRRSARRAPGVICASWPERGGAMLAG